jgi:hypothetical protein
MYCTRSSSCCGLSNCCCVDLTAFDCVRSWCLCDNVDRLQCHLAATFRYEKGAHSSSLSIDAIALSIADILVELSRVQGWCQSGVLMLVAHHANWLITPAGTVPCRVRSLVPPKNKTKTLDPILFEVRTMELRDLA